MTRMDDTLIITKSYSNGENILVDFQKRKRIREEAEKIGEEGRHPIAGVILWNKNKDKILIVKKLSSSGEKRLHGTKSVFFGEHILEDMQNNETKNFDFSLLSKHITNDLLPEEIHQAEVKLLDEYPRFQLLSQQGVGKSHIGFIFEGVIENNENEIKLIEDERNCGFQDIGEIKKDLEKFNGWSQTIIKYLEKHDD